MENPKTAYEPGPVVRFMNWAFGDNAHEAAMSLCEKTSSVLGQAADFGIYTGETAVYSGTLVAGLWEASKLGAAGHPQVAVAVALGGAALAVGEFVVANAPLMGPHTSLIDCLQEKADQLTSGSTVYDAMGRFLSLGERPVSVPGKILNLT